MNQNYAPQYPLRIHPASESLSVKRPDGTVIKIVIPVVHVVDANGISQMKISPTREQVAKGEANLDHMVRAADEWLIRLTEKRDEVARVWSDLQAQATS